MKRILVTQLGFIGDVILSTPVISALRRKFPDAEISLLTTAIAAPLVEHHAAKISVIGYDKRKKDRGLKGFFKIRTKISAENFDAVFSLHKSTRTTLLHFLSGIPQRFGFKEASLNFLYSKTVTRKPYPHDVDRNLSVLKNIDLENISAEFRLEIPNDVKEKVSKLIPTERYIVISPGSVWKTKRWTVQGYIELINRLNSTQIPILLLGSPDEIPIGDAIYSKIQNTRVINFIGKLSLIEAAGIISKAALIVTNDSAPLHLASAFNIPTVVTFCSTVPAFGYGPYGQKHRIIEVEGLACRPCGTHGRNYCPTGTHACQTRIKSESVFNAITDLLEIE